jgi:hypothetical protein
LTVLPSLSHILSLTLTLSDTSALCLFLLQGASSFITVHEIEKAIMELRDFKEAEFANFNELGLGKLVHHPTVRQTSACFVALVIVCVFSHSLPQRLFIFLLTSVSTFSRLLSVFRCFFAQVKQYFEIPDDLDDVPPIDTIDLLSRVSARSVAALFCSQSRTHLHSYFLLHLRLLLRFVEKKRNSSKDQPEPFDFKQALNDIAQDDFGESSYLYLGVYVRADTFLTFLQSHANRVIRKFGKASEEKVSREKQTSDLFAWLTLTLFLSPFALFASSDFQKAAPRRLRARCGEDCRSAE